MSDKNSSWQEDLLMRDGNMFEALEAISDEALRLLRLCNENPDLSDGLHLIHSLANYKMDVRSINEIERSSPVKVSLYN
jgi:hypothetical protein